MQKIFRVPYLLTTSEYNIAARGT